MRFNTIHSIYYNIYLPSSTKIVIRMPRVPHTTIVTNNSSVQ